MKTLVLNAGYEPMSVVSFKRAVVLVLAGRATVLAASGARVRSEHLDIEQPAVILLTRYIRPPAGRIAQPSRKAVLRRDHNSCGYCGKPAGTIDHILPRSRGGQNTWENLVACCRDCNNRKADRTPQEMGWQLQSTPGAPEYRGCWLRELERPAPAWQPFLNLAEHGELTSVA